MIRKHATHLKVFDKTCLACIRRVSNIEKAVPCHFCEKYSHRKCSYLSEQQIIDFGTKIQQRICNSCGNDAFPLNCISTHELLCDNFNSNEYCPCNDTTDFHPNIDNDIDHNMNLNFDCNYYTIDEFHKLCNKLNQYKSPFLV